VGSSSAPAKRTAVRAASLLFPSFAASHVRTELCQVHRVVWLSGRSCVDVSDESQTTGGALERSLRYRELLRPFGFGYELGGAFVDGSLWGGMDLIRGSKDPDFSGGEVALVKRVAPHIGAGLKAAALRSCANVAQDTPEVPGVLTLDRSGKEVSSLPHPLGGTLAQGSGRSGSLVA
jgi:hypothetical protein